MHLYNVISLFLFFFFLFFLSVFFFNLVLIEQTIPLLACPSLFFFSTGLLFCKELFSENLFVCIWFVFICMWVGFVVLT